MKHSIPDSPPMATIGGNVLIHGSGHLSHAAGFHSEMLNGLEVVLPTGEIVKIGSCLTSPYWFGRAPLPDLAGLFLGWFGTTGIVTKLAIKLFPNRPYQDVGVFVTEDPELVPDVLHRVTGVQVAEDVTAWMTPRPDWARGFQHININYAADTPEELTGKRNLIRASLQKYIREKVGGFMVLPPPMKRGFLEAPQTTLVQFADVRKGGRSQGGKSGREDSRPRNFRDHPGRSNMTPVNHLDPREIIELLNKCWMTHDVMWFYQCLKELGIEKANQMNKAAIKSLAPIEVSRIRKTL